MPLPVDSGHLTQIGTNDRSGNSIKMRRFQFLQLVAGPHNRFGHGFQILGNGIDACRHPRARLSQRSEEHTSELQSLMRISYAVFCLKKKTKMTKPNNTKLTTIKTNTNQHI